MVKDLEIKGILNLKDQNFSAGIKVAMKGLKLYGLEAQRVSKSIELIQENVSGLTKALAQIDENSIEELKKSLMDMKTEADHVVFYAGQLKENLLTIKDIGVNAFDSIRQSVQFQEAFEKVKQWGIDAFENVKQQCANKFREAYENVSQWSGDAFEGIKQQLSNKFGDAFEHIKVRGRGVLEDIKNKSAEFADKFEGIKQKGLDAFDNIKKRSIAFEEKLKTIHESGVAAFEKINEKIAENQPTIDAVRGVIDDLENNVSGLKTSLADAFESTKPTVEWLKNNGLPGVGDFVAGIGVKAMDLHNYIDRNWTKFQPIIQGVSGALDIYEKSTAAVQKATEIYTQVTGGLAKAQGLLNQVMNMSPWGIAAIAIGALIAIGILLWKNWDTIQEKALVLWEGIKSTFGGVGQFFEDTFKKAFEGVLAFFSPAIQLINSVIEGLNKINFKVPNWVPGIGGAEFGINIPKIPEFALGTTYATEGLALMHERGGEIRYTSRGETIIPADKSEKLVKSINNAPNITIHINGSNLTTREVVNEMVPKLKLALANI